MLAKMIPLLIAGGITVHSSSALQDKFKTALGMSSEYVTKQRMGTILRAARLHVVAEGDFNVRGQKNMRQWIRNKVTIEKKDTDDPSLDLWGTPFQSKLHREGLTLVSAGPDKKFGSADDLTATSNIYDY